MAKVEISIGEDVVSDEILDNGIEAEDVGAAVANVLTSFGFEKTEATQFIVSFLEQMHENGQIDDPCEVSDLVTFTLEEDDDGLGDNEPDEDDDDEEE